MAFRFHSALADVVAASPPVPAFPRGDAFVRRDYTRDALRLELAATPAVPHVRSIDFAVQVDDGQILARWYVRDGARPGSAVVYFHGGGMISGSVELLDGQLRDYVDRSGIPFLSVDYRLAPEHNGPTPARDGLAALRWLLANADELGVDPARVAVMGESAGGGVAAAVAIAARNAGIGVARQILICPMLDDRNLEPDPHLEPFVNWTYDDNYTGWHALLGDTLGTDAVSPLSAPAREIDHAGLAPAFIDIGELDIFRDESTGYALRLWAAGVSAELHVRPGANHGYHRLIPDSAIGIASWTDQWRVLAEL